MISIVICSVNSTYLQNIRENITKTIGVEFELLVWDNVHGNKGLCEVYNLMAEKANYPYLCFMHEDILFQTDQWGKILCGLFAAHPETGMIGIAGTTYKSGMFSGWYTANNRFDFYNYVHRTNGVDHRARQPLEGIGFAPVVCIDGVLMVCRREVWLDTRFDAKALKGFHFYDIDFSLRASRKYGIAVTMAIDLVHITQGGDYGDRWVEAAMQYHARYAGFMPYSLEGVVEPHEIGRVETGVAAAWLNRLKNEKISWRNKKRWIQEQKLMRHWPALWYPILRFLVFRPFQLDKLQKLFRRNHIS